ncbi:GNAT family N-acetyltransferase [Candidatus Woesearchaeota archaeon]|jgi:ribosomal protein S18 acetylase RimI-like enzyme|nr:GNAT family N-acetyltransferase [Candidatus Woesearchaeota archaeon]MBT5272783.1 GNAT family N-acetyltransferase [Candidatus Woesearchaeota archaeon]MBT6040395.1 GNAT family N-acetyltransferase [Candidatus Woesearchaeota archaeon]MBT6336972.1 GNAT family N-acetyltransferase [Candidatus Woesearchaeota archaeon]MBT7926858.1 GNAT family N-acetyltransferase [Candidatus Woesearchaeota archaeon]
MSEEELLNEDEMDSRRNALFLSETKLAKPDVGVTLGVLEDLVLDFDTKISMNSLDTPADANKLLDFFKVIDQYWMLPLSEVWGLEAYVKRVTTGKMLYLTNQDNKIMGLIAYREHYQDQNIVGPYISTVAVLPEHHGKGLGQKLMGSAISDLHSLGLDNIWIKTWTTNKAISLYKRNGFEVKIYLPDDRKPGVGSIYLRRDSKAKD